MQISHYYDHYDLLIVIGTMGVLLAFLILIVLAHGLNLRVVPRVGVAHRAFRSGGRQGFLTMVSTDKEMDAEADASIENAVNSPVWPVTVTPTAHDIATGRDPARVKIFDTTLRDGEQSPGCTMNTEEKLLVAKQLAKLGVDIIEAGFPIASEGDFEAVSKIAKSVGNLEDPPIICGLARALKKDISTCYDAIKHAKFPRIHTFIATSDIHMEHKLKKTREQVLDITTEMVSHAKSLCEDVEFSAEDALRSDFDFLYEVYSRAVEAGATTLNVPDTVGYTTPAEFFSLIKGMRGNVRGIDKVTISVHGHNDLGMAVANFLAAIEGGARQMECTINGIGERAGNAALEELVMGLHVRKAYYNKFFERPEDSDKALTNVRTDQIYKSSRLVSSITGMVVQANKAIVGANAFAHESGIHQDGVLKNKRTYEIMDAESIGLVENNIVLGKHSGRHAFRSRLAELGYDNLADDELNRAFIRFKEIADKKKEINNADLVSIVGDEVTMDINDKFKLVGIQIICGDRNTPTATATVYDEFAGEERTISATGTGPVDAAFKAIRILLEGAADDVKLLEYTVSSVTAGIDALGEVTVRLQDAHSQKIVYGRASNTDVFVASANAYMCALNRILATRGDSVVHPQFNSLT
jgi:2-isopropylmalate synthase